jgi:hypothetical protein
MHRDRFAFLFVGSILVTACAVARSDRHDRMAGATSTCADTSSTIAQWLRGWVVASTAPQSTKADSFRVRLELPRLPADSVVIVNDHVVCRRAGLAYIRANEQPLTPGNHEVAVIRAGRRYVVRSVTAPARAGEWNIISIFDDKFRLTSTVLGG